MSNVRITELTHLSSLDLSNEDVYVIVDVSADETKKLSHANLIATISGGTSETANVLALQSGLEGANLAFAVFSSNTQANVVSIQSSITTISSDLTNNQSNVVALQGGLTGANSNISALQGGLTGANSNISTLQGITDATQSNVVALQGGLTGANSNIFALQGVTDATQSNVISLQGVTDATQSNVVALQGGLTGANSNISTLQGVTNATQSNVIALQGVTDATQSNVVALQGGLTGANSNISTLQGVTDATQSNVIALQGVTDATQSNVIALQGATDATQSNVVALQGGLTGANSNISTLQGVTDATQSNVVALQGGLTGANSEISQKASLSGATFTGSVTIPDLYLTGTLNANSSIGTSGQVLSSTGTGVDWITLSAGSGDITAVIAGDGLTGGATSGDATLSVVGGTGVTSNSSGVFIGQDVSNTASVQFSSVSTSNLSVSSDIIEGVYSISGTSVALNPVNGTIQTHTLSGATTYTDAFSSGQAITLMIDDGTAYTITWPTMTWINNAGVAPTLATSGYTVVSLWKVSSTLYGALVGDGT